MLVFPTGTSPERGVSEGDSAPELSGSHGELFPIASLPRGSEVTDCLVYHEHATSPVAPEVPEDLYNLTQLAEVSLAAAAGHIFRPSPSKLEVPQHNIMFVRQHLRKYLYHFTYTYCTSLVIKIFMVCDRRLKDCTTIKQLQI